MSQPTPLIDLVLTVYSDTLGYVRKAVADIPADRFCEQPGGLVNHPAWTLAHLVAASNFIPHLLGAQPLADARFDAFGPGSIPVSDLSVYPGKDELLEKLSEVHTLAEQAVREKHATHFDRPSPEHLRSFSPTLGRMITFLLASHETYHLGQLAQWRRAAGLVRS